jgi:hypothetical protein
MEGICVFQRPSADLFDPAQSGAFLRRFHGDFRHVVDDSLGYYKVVGTVTDRCSSLDIVRPIDVSTAVLNFTVR